MLFQVGEPGVIARWSEVLPVLLAVLSVDISSLIEREVAEDEHEAMG